MKLPLQLDFLVSKDCLSVTLVKLWLVYSFIAVFIQHLQITQLVKVFNVNAFVLFIECLILSSLIKPFHHARPKKLLFRVRHKQISFLRKDVRIFNDYLSGDGKQKVEFLQSVLFDFQRAPAFWVVAQESQSFVIVEIKSQFLYLYLWIIAIDLHLTRHTDRLLIDQIAQCCHGDLKSFIFLAFCEIQLDLFNVFAKGWPKIRKRLLFLRFDLVSTPFKDAQSGSIFFEAATYLFINIICISCCQYPKIWHWVSYHNYATALIMHRNYSHCKCQSRP